MRDYETVTHSFGPVFDEKSRILILGSIPSVKSREINFYYGHPQNRFWKVISAVLNTVPPTTTEEKTGLLLENGIALWDVIERCNIIGSSDSSIKNVIPNDIYSLISELKISRIFVNGAKAEELYNKFCFRQTKIRAVKLPSTSPANASWTTERLIVEWKRLLNI